MVSNPSAFQTLPTLVVDMIIEYLEGRFRRSSHSNINDHNMYKEALAPLVLVSERWRAAVLYSICDNCTLKYNYYSKTIEASFPAWPISLTRPSADKYSLVKHVVVKATTWADSRDSVFSETFDNPQYVDLVFPSATTLELHLGKPLYDVFKGDLEAAKMQVARFANSLPRVLPAAANINVMIHSSDGWENPYQDVYSALLSELCQATTKELRIVSKFRDLPMALDSCGASGLSSITHEIDDHHSEFAILAYRNAKTLETLRIRLDRQGKSWLKLLTGGTKTLAVYSKLAVLNIQSCGEYWHSAIRDKWAVGNDMESFPSLSELDVTGLYPFADNVLFRGNGKSMQILSLSFSAIYSDVLGEFKVLERSGFSQMSRVCIGAVYNYSHRMHLDERQTLSIRLQVHSILETATTLGFWNDTTDYAILGALASAPVTTILQRLDIGNMALDAVHIIQIVSAIPTLVVITCDISEAGADIFVIPESKRLHSHYNDNDLPGICFRKLCVPNMTNASGSRIADAAMAVATECPNLMHVDVPLRLRKDFSREISRTGQLNGSAFSDLAFSE
ncbi:hypothetical protein GGI21_000600 [Coemansia aciculifera]|nr:hypothetical protein GGI21_000600 [Coemansia aciculifera]